MKKSYPRLTISSTHVLINEYESYLCSNDHLSSIYVSQQLAISQLTGFFRELFFTINQMGLGMNS